MAVHLGVLTILLTTLSVFVNSVYSIDCYQCSGTDSRKPFECNEFLDSTNNLEATNCTSIYGAKYCIKHVGRYEVHSTECYQCNTSCSMECTDVFINMEDSRIRAMPCSNVHDANYCIKISGGISTKRYCSSLDLGNYCNYVQQPGDKLSYRTCVYTCSTDGCNSATSNGLSLSAITLFVLLNLI